LLYLSRRIKRHRHDTSQALKMKPEGTQLTGAAGKKKDEKEKG
jgi:hypothetical protein